MSVQIQPLEGCLASATAMQAALANSVLHLYKSSFNPSPSDPLANFTAAEADYDAYAALTMAAWNDPILSPGSGYMILSPLEQFEVGLTDPTTPNVIGGCYLVDAAGKLRQYVSFTAPIPMQLAGQGIPITLTLPFPTAVTF